MKELIGKRIRKLRESKDLTQDNMAMDLGITAGAYAKIERGETDPSATRLVQIAEILEVDVTSFFTDNTNISSNRVEQTSQQPYGYATRSELEQLTSLVKQLSRDMEKLKSQIAAAKKPAKKAK